MPLIRRIAAMLGLAVGTAAIIVYGVIGLLMFACGGVSFSPPSCGGGVEPPPVCEDEEFSCVGPECATDAECQARAVALGVGCNANSDCLGQGAGDTCFLTAEQPGLSNLPNVCVASSAGQPCPPGLTPILGELAEGGAASFCGDISVVCTESADTDETESFNRERCSSAAVVPP